MYFYPPKKSGVGNSTAPKIYNCIIQLWKAFFALSILSQPNCWWTFCKKRFSHCEQKKIFSSPLILGLPLDLYLYFSSQQVFPFSLNQNLQFSSPFVFGESFLWTPSVSFVDKGAFISPKFLLCKLPPHFSTRAREENHLCKIILQFSKLSLEFIFVI